MRRESLSKLAACSPVPAAVLCMLCPRFRISLDYSIDAVCADPSQNSVQSPLPVAVRALGTVFGLSGWTLGRRCAGWPSLALARDGGPSLVLSTGMTATCVPAAAASGMVPAPRLKVG